jgi:hypothetical protein
MHRRPAPRTTLTASLLAMLLAGCTDDTGTAPLIHDDDAPAVLSRPATLGQLQDRARSAPLRLEIEVRPGGPPWIAREVEIENDDDDEEKLESRIASADAAAGTLTLILGDLTVDVSGASRFRAEGSGDVSMAGFFERVDAALAAGRTPGVELRRRLPTEPQDPNDPGFLPRDVRLDDDAETGELEVLVDGRHVTTDSDSSGRITVFGIEIVVDRSLGSEVGERTEQGDGAVEVEGLVDTVDPAGGTVTVRGGPTFRIVPGTRFDVDDDEPSSLAQVADALAAGHWVEVEGELVRDTDGSWIAVEVEFGVEDDADDDVHGSHEFEGRVTAADPAARSFTLGNGQTLTIDEGTRIEGDGDLFSLEQVAAALAASVQVEAEGHVLPDAAAPGGLRVVSVKFETDDDGDDGDGDDGAREFDGVAVAVDAAAGTFTLESGATYGVDDTTRYEADGDLFSLAAAADALAQGKKVEMEGDAVPDASAPGGWRVSSLKIEVDD